MISRGVCVFACWWWCPSRPRHTPGYSSSRSTQLTGLRSNKILAGSKQESWPWHTNIGGDDAHFLHRNIVFANNYAHANNVVQMSAARVRLTSVLWCLVWPAARAGLVPSI